MPHYHTMGTIPHKRHTQFRKPDGKLYAEELFSTEGFSNDYSLIYHCHPPTEIIATDDPYDVSPVIAEEKMLKHRSFEGFKLQPRADFLASRKAILVNSDCHIVLAAPERGTGDYFYKNADADEMIFVHEGSGRLNTMYGTLEFGYGDYLVVPRGTIYQVDFNEKNNRLFIVESFSPIRYPKKYLSKYGQLLEHSPFCERDIRAPKDLITVDEKGDFLIGRRRRAVCMVFTTDIILLMRLGGMGAVILLLSVFTTLSLLQAGYISLRRYIRLLKGIIMLCVHLFPGCLIIIHRRFLRLITIVTSIAMSSFIMLMAIL